MPSLVTAGWARVLKNYRGDDLVSTVAAFAVVKRAERMLCAFALVNLTVRALIGANLNSTGFVLAA